MRVPQRLPACVDRLSLSASHFVKGRFTPWQTADRLEKTKAQSDIHTVAFRQWNVFVTKLITFYMTQQLTQSRRQTKTHSLSPFCDPFTREAAIIIPYVLTLNLQLLHTVLLPSERKFGCKFNNTLSMSFYSLYFLFRRFSLILDYNKFSWFWPSIKLSNNKLYWNYRNHQY